MVVLGLVHQCLVGGGGIQEIRQVHAFGIAHQPLGDAQCAGRLGRNYGRTLPRLGAVISQWTLGFTTLPVTWAYWTSAGDDLRYVFYYYLALLRVAYYATLALLARDVRRGDVIPKGLASWPSTLRFLRRKSGDLWPPFTILLIALYCMYVY